MLQALKRARVKHVLVPSEQATEALLVRGIAIHPVQIFREAWTTLYGGLGVIPALRGKPVYCQPTSQSMLRGPLPERLREPAQRVLAALRRGQAVLLRSRLSSGRTLVVRWAVDQLPNLSPKAALEVATIASAAGLTAPGACLPIRPPLRAPHYSASLNGVIGTMQAPGEVTLAHRGVLLLDEVAEFSRPVLEGVREAQRAGVIHLVGPHGGALVPAKFALVATLTTGQDSDERDINRVWKLLWSAERDSRLVLVHLDAG